MYVSDQPRMIVHMDLDSFFVSVERLKNPQLKGVPLIIAGQGGRGVVSSCSYEARKYGVRSGMPTAQARRLCRQATIISGDHEAYSQYSDMVSKIVFERSPLCEQASIDEFFIDLTGMDKYIGGFKWTQELVAEVTRETGLPLSFGLATCKAVAKMATNEAKPNGRLWVQSGKEQEFLDPLPVRKIPYVGAVMTDRLAQLGISDIAALRQVPLKVLQRLFGKGGNMLWQRAHGKDDSLVVPYRQEKSHSTEATFQEDTTDVVAILATLQKMAEGLSHVLRRSGRLASCVTVKIRYSDFSTHTKQASIPHTSRTGVLTRKAKELFGMLYDRRLRIRLVGVCFSGLAYGGDQADLFSDTEELLSLDKAMDRIKNRFGANAVMSASALGGLGRYESHAFKEVKVGHRPPKQDRSAREFPEWVPDASYWETTQDGF